MKRDTVRLPRGRGGWVIAAASAVGCAAACSSSPKASSFQSADPGAASAGSGSSSAFVPAGPLSDGGGGTLGNIGSDPPAALDAAFVDSGRPARCDDSGRCSCFNIASIGKPGHYGAANDNTDAFVNWLNTESSASVAMFPSKPTLTADFLSNYDVIILQWLTDGYNGPYWNFSADEISALKDWVNAGGGLIALSGYDTNSAEVMPLNQLLSFTDMSYNTDTILSACAPGQNCACWGNTVPVTGWQSGPIGKNVTAIGAQSGRSINPGSATIDDSSGVAPSGQPVVYAAHESVGKGDVFAWCDEWVTYTSQWWGPTGDGGPDSGAATSPTDACYMMSAEQVFQVPQWWYNVISYAASSTQCAFTINDTPIVR